MKNALMMTTTTVSTLSNKQLKANMNIMLKALETGRKAGWTYAAAVTAIVDGEQFKDDFKTLDKFAAFAGTTKGSISQMVNSVLFAVKQGIVPTDKKGNLDFTNCKGNVTACYLLSTLGADFDEFVRWLADSKGLKDVYALSNNAIRELMKEFKKPAIEQKEATEEATEETTEETTEEATEDVKTKRIETVEQAKEAITYMMLYFNITADMMVEHYLKYKGKVDVDKKRPCMVLQEKH